MTKHQESKDITTMFSDEGVLTWMDEHMTELREYVSGQRLLYQSLAISFVIGLAAHVCGYILLLSMQKELLGLLADLLHALGWSLWTGVVVAVFIQIIPEVKRRQIRQVLDAYEALQRDKTQAGGSH